MSDNWLFFEHLILACPLVLMNDTIHFLTYYVDITPSNILVNKMSDFKLSGYDICKHLNGDGRVLDEDEWDFDRVFGTTSYMAVSTFCNVYIVCLCSEPLAHVRRVQ